jgi:DNA-binding NtrC family response regulator
MHRILIVDDDYSMRMALSQSLENCGYGVETAEDGEVALAMFQKGKFAAVITDMRMPKMSGLDVLRGIKKLSADTAVIMITAYGTVNIAVEAMKEGAAEFIMKPFSLADLESVVKSVLSSNGDSQKNDYDQTPSDIEPERKILSTHPKVMVLMELMRNVAKSKSSVLIQGESGTGKELFARFIHSQSHRNKMPFVAVNCAAIPHNLLESEMFGYERGAFTGASQRKIGKFEQADGGTLLLDEISEMDIQLQAKLLRVIQESEVDRLGGKEPVPIDVRIIATTNSDLQQAIEEKKFRSDLYYRLNVIPVKIPPLRDRNSDVSLLCEHFIKKYSRMNGRKPPALSSEALNRLEKYSWPGNIRELENLMERAVLIVNGSTIEGSHIDLEGYGEIEHPVGAVPDHPQTGDDAPTTLREMEKTLIYKTLDKAHGNKTKASRILGISVRTMRNKLHEYGLEGKWDDQEGS